MVTFGTRGRRDLRMASASFSVTSSAGSNSWIWGSISARNAARYSRIFFRMNTPFVQM
jgi:hypothetical protein